MRIDVTRQDIRSGGRCLSDSCPIHNAIQRELEARGLKSWFRLHVSRRAVTVEQLLCPNIPDLATFRHVGAVYVPEQVRDAIARFDAIGEMEPFSFELGDHILALVELDEAQAALTAAPA